MYRFDVPSCVQLTEVVWGARGYTLPGVLRGLAEAGVIPETIDIEAAEREAGRPLWESSDLDMALSLAQNVEMFNGESGSNPAPNDDLLVRFAAATGGVLEPRWVYQEQVSDHQVIGFVHEGRAYRLTVPLGGDWYDYEAVAAMANEALRRRGSPVRMVKISGEPCYLCADPALICSTFRRYGMEVDEEAIRGEGAPEWLRKMAREALMKA